MTPFTTLTGPVAVIARANVDTDQIIPARFLRKPRSAGYGRFLFADEPGSPVPEGAAIVVAGENFGCGSSREGAVYALVDAGIRCVIAPSFGDIFAGNAAKNGLLTIELPEAALAAFQAGAPATVDLLAQEIRVGNHVIGFEIDAFRKRCLIGGLDDIGMTLEHEAALDAFERADRAGRSWAEPAR